MNLVSREELKEKIDRGDVFKLVMAMDDWHYRAKHIPGSISASALIGTEISQLKDKEKIIKAIKSVATRLQPEDEIIVYCAHISCVGSVYAYEALEKAGFKNIRRYAVGIADWEDAGYRLEGES